MRDDITIFQDLMDKRFKMGEKTYKSAYKKMTRAELLHEAQDECVDIGNYLRFVIYNNEDDEVLCNKMASIVAGACNLFTLLEDAKE